MKTPYDLPEGENYQKYLRYYYAGQAMQWLIISFPDEEERKIAELAVCQADELIKELAK